MDRTKGIIKHVTEKGYGFAAVDGESDVFVHQRYISSELGREMAIGDELEFTRVKTDRGYQAVDVVVLEPSQEIPPYMVEPGVPVEEEMGIFIPVVPINAAKVILDYFEDHEVRELNGYLESRIV